MKKTKLKLVATTMAFGVVAFASHANLLINGDFETGNFSGWTVGSTQVNPFQAALNDGQNSQIVNSVSGQPAWFLRNKSANYFGNPFAATPINNFSAFNGFDGSGGNFFLQQGFTVSAALQSANLSFTYAVQNNNNPPARTFSVNILSSGGLLLATTYNYTLPLGYNPTWSPTTINLDIAGVLNGLGVGNYQIQFLEVVPSNFSGPAQFAIDDISLDTAAVAAVPEPSTYIAAALLLLPFGAHTVRHLRKHKQVS